MRVACCWWLAIYISLILNNKSGCDSFGRQLRRGGLEFFVRRGHSLGLPRRFGSRGRRSKSSRRMCQRELEAQATLCPSRSSRFYESPRNGCLSAFLLVRSPP